MKIENQVSCTFLNILQLAYWGVIQHHMGECGSVSHEKTDICHMSEAILPHTVILRPLENTIGGIITIKCPNEGPTWRIHRKGLRYIMAVFQCDCLRILHLRLYEKMTHGMHSDTLNE